MGSALPAGCSPARGFGSRALYFGPDPIARDRSPPCRSLRSNNQPFAYGALCLNNLPFSSDPVGLSNP